MEHLPELLSPAGSFESLVAAVNAGADAVYVGGKRFSARAYASNFDIDELIKGIEYCHLRDVKIYLTVNTVFKEHELEELLNYLSTIYSQGIDALIVQDIGVASLIKRELNMPLHASTQMTIHNLNGVKYLDKLGFERVVLSRELSLKDISYIIKNTDTEIECFVHGALCYSYSGQCLMSSILGGRSGNRGRCAGTCRLPFALEKNDQRINNKKNKYLLSPKDIQTLDILPELINTGIHSFKIEGRMKNEAYVAGVTYLYKKYIEKCLTDRESYYVEDRDREMLLDLYNRGGFSTGYYNNKKSMMVMNKPNNWGTYVGKVQNMYKQAKKLDIKVEKAISPGDCLEIWTDKEPHYSFISDKESNQGILTINRLKNINNVRTNDKVYRIKNKVLVNLIDNTIINQDKKEIIKCNISVKVGKPFTIELYYKNFTSKSEGYMVEKAQKQAVSKDRIIKQVEKTGDYPFTIEINNLELDGEVFIPISEINRVRRVAIESLVSKILESHKRETPNKTLTYRYQIQDNVKSRKMRLNVLIRDFKQFNVIYNYEEVNSLILESEFFSYQEIQEIICRCHKVNIKVYLALPRVFTKNIEEKTKVENYNKLDISGFLIRTYAQFYILKESNKDLVIDYNMNIFNNMAVNTWLEEGANRICLSPELNYGEIKKLETTQCEILTYGYLPLMVSEQCVIDNATKDHCGKKGAYYIKDRYGKSFLVDTRCDHCYNLIYNSSPLMLFDQLDKIKQCSIGHFRLEFTSEKPTEVDSILTIMSNIINGRNYTTEEILKQLNISEFNRGHFIRGIK